MNRLSWLLLAPLLAAGVSLVLVDGVVGAERKISFQANLADAGGGDRDGSGTARISIDFSEVLELCWHVTVKHLAPVTAAHIHIGAAGDDGDVVLDIPGVPSGGCRGASEAELNAIIADPAGSYVDVHTEDYPDGAIRGQLVADTPDTAMERPSSSLWAAIGLLLVVVAGLAAIRWPALRGSVAIPPGWSAAGVAGSHGLTGIFVRSRSPRFRAQACATTGRRRLLLAAS